MGTKYPKFLHVQKCWFVAIIMNDSFSGYKILESHLVFLRLNTKVSLPCCLLTVNDATWKSRPFSFHLLCKCGVPGCPKILYLWSLIDVPDHAPQFFFWIFCGFQYIQVFYFWEGLLNHIFKYTFMSFANLLFLSFFSLILLSSSFIFISLLFSHFSCHYPFFSAFVLRSIMFSCVAFNFDFISKIA